MPRCATMCKNERSTARSKKEIKNSRGMPLFISRQPPCSVSAASLAVSFLLALIPFFSLLYPSHSMLHRACKCRILSSFRFRSDFGTEQRNHFCKDRKRLQIQRYFCIQLENSSVFEKNVLLWEYLHPEMCSLPESSSLTTHFCFRDKTGIDPQKRSQPLEMHSCRSQPLFTSLIESLALMTAHCKTFEMISNKILQFRICEEICKIRKKSLEKFETIF